MPCFMYVFYTCRAIFVAAKYWRLQLQRKVAFLNRDMYATHTYISCENVLWVQTLGVHVHMLHVHTLCAMLLCTIYIHALYVIVLWPSGMSICVPELRVHNILCAHTNTIYTSAMCTRAMGAMYNILCLHVLCALVLWASLLNVYVARSILCLTIIWQLYSLYVCKCLLSVHISSLP